MGFLDLLRSLTSTADPVVAWEVQFDEGGRVYTYRCTRRAFLAKMAQRLEGPVERELPHRVVRVDNGERVEVRLRADELRA